MKKLTLCALLAMFALAGCMKDKQRVASPTTAKPKVASGANRAAARPPTLSKPTKKDTTTKPLETTKVKAKAGKILVLADLSFMVKDRSGAMRELMALKADGTVTVNNSRGTRTFRLRADGKILEAGTVLVELDKDGVIYGKNGRTKLRISPDGTLEGGRKPVTFAADGIFGLYGRGPRIKVLGLTKKTRRTAMYMLSMMFFVGHSSSAPPAGP